MDMRGATSLNSRNCCQVKLSLLAHLDANKGSLVTETHQQDTAVQSHLMQVLSSRLQKNIGLTLISAIGSLIRRLQVESLSTWK